MTHPLRLLLFVLAALPLRAANFKPITLKIADPAGDAWHVHARGAFSITVTPSGGVAPTALHYQWRDFTGKALTDWAPVPKTPFAVPDTHLAFYDLALKCTDERYALPQRQPGEIREYGFVVMPQRKESQRARNDASHLGIVHLDFNENDGANPRACPYISGWCKTLDWNHNYSGKWVWKTYIQERINVGLKELPLATGGPWSKVDNSRLAPEEELEAIYREAHDRLAQEKACLDPGTTRTFNWELGLEESTAVSDPKQPHYLENLRAKSEQFKKAAADLEIENLNLIWQDVEWNSSKTADKFLGSGAASNFNTLAVHPYPWVNGKQDFIDPETWLPTLISGIKATMTAHHQVKPIWFTEVGAPVQYNFPSTDFGGSFETNKFGYPDGKGDYKKNGWPVYDNGITRQHIGTYMAKIFALGLYGGVEKFFWYNFKDSGADPYYAEHTFGLFDHDNFPKPSFATWCLIDAMLGSRPSNSTSDETKVAHHGTSPIEAYEFQGKTPTAPRLLVAWTSDGSTQNLDIGTLGTPLTGSTISQIKDVVGSVLPSPAGTMLAIGGDPLFIVLKIPPPPPEKPAPQKILRPALPSAATP